MMMQRRNSYLYSTRQAGSVWLQCLSFGLLLLLGYGGSASAEGLYANCVRNSGYYQYFDTATVEVGKDSAVGDALGPWISSNNTTAWNCTPNSSYQQPIQFSVQGYPPYTTRNTIVVDGQTYMLYNTTVKTGLGYIVRWRYTLNGKTTAWQPLTIATGGQQTHSESISVYYSAGTKFYLGVDAQVRLVKTTAGLTSGAIPLFDPIYLRHLQTYNGTSAPGDTTYMIAEFKSGGATISSGGTCTTPNVNVNLPEASVSQFTGVGTVAGRKAFNLVFNQCPAGLSSIGYSFAATTPVVDAANGVVAPNATSTASGVGIQLLRDNNTPVTFGTVYLLDNYDASAKANYTVPMQAGLFQIGNFVTAGSANTAITFTLNYK